MSHSRRQFVAGSALGAAMLLAPMAAAQGGASSCYDPAKLSLSQRNRRRSLGYLEVSNDPKKRCSLCAFFTATAGGCGGCQLLGNGPVDSKALCTSFAKKGG